MFDFEERLEAGEAFGLDGFTDLIVDLGSGRAGARRIFERVGLGEADLGDQVQGLLEFGFGFAREADDDVGRERDVRADGADLADQSTVFLRGVLAVHGGEDAVGASLERQMKVGHQLADICVRMDQIIGHVARVAGRVTQALDAVDRSKAGEQLCQRPGLIIGAVAVVSVDVLAEQGQFTDAAGDELFGFNNDLADRTGVFRSARVGDHAESAEFIAAFLDGQKSGRRAGRHGRTGGQVVELFVVGENGFDLMLCLRRDAGQHFGQAMVALRADHDVDDGGAGDDFGAFGLGHATGNGDNGVFAECAALVFHFLDAAEVRIDLFGSLFANVAGIEDDQVGVGLVERFGIADRAELLSDALAIVNVHLTTERFEKDLLGLTHAVTSG